MFGWNPFKKNEGVPPPPQTHTTNSADELLAEIVSVRDDTLGQDLRPMQRLIRDSEFLLPLHEPPRQTENGLVLRYMTVEDDSVLVAFTDAQRLRDFFGGQNPLGGTQMAVAPVSGRTVCNMAQHANLRKIILNPNSDILFALHPMVYRAIAHGFVIGHISDEAFHTEHITLGPNVAGMPDDELLADFRAVLQELGAKAAYWCGLMLPPDELRFAIGVDIEAEQFQNAASRLPQCWIGKWPLPTPLHVFHLGQPQNTVRDEAIRACDRIF